MPESSEDFNFELQLQGLKEWRNIPPVIKQAFANLYTQLKAQNHTIQELENRQQGFVKQQDFLSGLSSKVSIQEHAFKLLRLEEQIAKAATPGDLHDHSAAQTALQKKVNSLSKSVDTKVSLADMQHFTQSQQQQALQSRKQLDMKVAVLSAASSKLATNLSSLHQNQEAAEKGAHAALRDIHRAIEGVSGDAATSVDHLSVSMDASMSEIKQSQAMQQSAMDKIVASLQQEVVQLRSSNESLRHHIDTKADKVYLQQVMEHLRNSKVCAVEFHAVRDELDTKAGIKDVNAALLQVSQDVDGKASAADLHDLRLFKDGGIIGPSGRWQWTNGKLRRNGAVAWNKHTSCDQQHFLHEKSDINVLKAGVYQVIVAFFSKRRPTFHLLVNGTVALRAGNHATYVGQHTAARAGCSDGSNGSQMSGMSLVEYLVLPSDACLTVMYQSQQEAGQGFLSLQQIC